MDPNRGHEISEYRALSRMISISTYYRGPGVSVRYRSKPFRGWKASAARSRGSPSIPAGASFPINPGLLRGNWGRGSFPLARKGEKGLLARIHLPGRWYGARLIKRQIRAQRWIGPADAGSPAQTKWSLTRSAIGSSVHLYLQLFHTRLPCRARRPSG